MDNHDTHKCHVLRKLKEEHKQKKRGREGGNDGGPNPKRSGSGYNKFQKDMYHKKQVEQMMTMVVAAVSKKSPPKAPKRKVKDLDLNALEESQQQPSLLDVDDISSVESGEERRVAEGFAVLDLSESEDDE